MSHSMHLIIKDLRRNHIVQHHIEHNRYIPQVIYTKLKQKKICDHCKKPFRGEPNEIHHIVPIERNGSNEEYNLMAVHKKCHEVLDYSIGVGNKYQEDQKVLKKLNVCEGEGVFMTLKQIKESLENLNKELDIQKETLTPKKKGQIVNIQNHIIGINNNITTLMKMGEE